jgi:hypothetical protein
MPPRSVDTPVFDSVLPNVLKAAGILTAAGVLVFTLAFGFAVKAIGAVYILGVISKLILVSCSFGHSATSFQFFEQNKKRPVRSHE